MNLRRALFFTALFCSTGTLHAQVCSGGGGGGMDITGNDCNDSTNTLMSVSAPGGEDIGTGMPPVLKASSDRGDQISGAQIPADKAEAARLEALLGEQSMPVGSASQAPDD